MTGSTSVSHKKWSTGSLLLCGGAVLALTAGPALAAGTYNFDALGSSGSDNNLSNPDVWSLASSSGSPDSASPPPINGDIGVIGAGDNADLGTNLYDPNTQNPPGELDVLTGGQLRLISSITENHNITLDGGTYTVTGNNNYYGTLFVRSGSTLDSANNTPDLRDPIKDAPDGSGGTTTGTLTVQKSGSKTFTYYDLKGDNSGFSGGFVVNSGGLNPDNANAFGTGDVQLNSGGIIRWNNTSSTFANNFILNGGTFFFRDSRDPGGTVLLRSDSSFTTENSDQARWDGLIADDGTNAGRLTYSGLSGSEGNPGDLGSLTLNFNNTYTGGTTVDGESRLIAGMDGALGFGDVRVTSTGDLELATDGSIRATQDLAIEDDGTDFGQVDLDANVIVASLDLGGTSIDAGTYNANSTANGVDFSQYFNGAGGITVAAVPEPASLALMGIGGLAMLGRRRRRGVKA